MDIDIQNNFIYRYRTVSDYSIKELIEDSIVFSTADTFNDPTDIALTFEPIDYSKEMLALKFVGQFMPKNYFENPRTRYMLSYSFDNQINTMIDTFKKNVIIGSFTREPCNPVMLSHYSGNRTGFVLGYSLEDIEKLITNSSIKGALHDVDYTGDKVSVGKEVIEYINAYTSFSGSGATLDYKGAQNIFNSCLIKDDKYKKSFYTKSPSWAYEREVRFIGYKKEISNESHVEIGKCVPKVIYIGDRISLKDKHLLLSIAREKDIKVYELMLSYREDQWGLSAVHIDKEMIDSFLKTNSYGYVVHSAMVPTK